MSTSSVPQTALDILRTARALLSDPARYIADAGASFAVDAAGFSCDESITEAVRFEVIGALKRSSVHGACDALEECYNLIASVINEGPAPDAWETLVVWQGVTQPDHATVLRVLDDAIATVVEADERDDLDAEAVRQ